MAEFIQRLLPPSINWDVKVAAAAMGTDAELDALYAKLPDIELYHRVAPQTSTLPVDVIEHLGLHFSVDCWRLLDAEQQRFLLAHAHELHRHKGTAYAFRFFCERILRGKLLAYAPPSRRFLSPSLSPAERQAWEDKHPEVRIYPFRRAGKAAKGQLFCGRYAAGALLQSDALLRAGDKYTLYDPASGAETELHSYVYDREQVSRVAAEQVEIRKPGKARGIFCGRLLRGCLCYHGAASRVYRITLAKTYADEIERRTPLAITPSLRPLTGYYQARSVAGQAGRRMFLSNRYTDVYLARGGAAFAGRCVASSDAGLRLFKALKLYDPTRGSRVQREAVAWLGASRLGRQRPHHAELYVEVQGRAGKRCFFASGFVGAGFPAVSDARARLAIMREALVQAKRLSDKIIVKTHHYSVAVVSDALAAGGLVAGGLVRKIIY